MPTEIVTFYSYKGGTGRSMALANVAWILASSGKRVLVLDWDMEAPGLHRYFHPFLEDKEQTSSEGIIDFVIEFAAEALSPSGPHEKDWYVPFANILRYASSLNWKFEPPGMSEPTGTLDFVPAGRQGPDYATRVNSFNWQKFYERLSGGVFIEAAKQSMAGYDYVLVDSRTGVSDTSGICTIQMPDTLVVCFTYNIQSIEGAVAVAESALQQRRSPSGEPTLRILPVPMRVEFAEKKKLDAAKEVARARFGPMLWHLTEARRAKYWERVQVSYQPFYAYEETLATFGDKPREPDTLLSKMEIITEYLTGKVTRFPSLPEKKRLEWLAKFTRQPTPVRRAASVSDNIFWFYLSYARGDANEYVKRFVTDLNSEVSQYAGLGADEAVGFFDLTSIETGDDWNTVALSALLTSRTMVCLYSPRYFNSEYCGKEFELFRSRLELYREASLGPAATPAILPVLLLPVDKSLPRSVSDIQYADSDFPRVYAEEGLLYMMKLRRKFREEYDELVSRFARKLVKVATEYPLPSLDTVPPLPDVPSAFADKGPAPKKTAQAGPSYAEFIFVAATRAEMQAEGIRLGLKDYGDEGWNWKPYSKVPVGIFAQAAASEESFRYQANPLTSDLMQQLEEADKSNTIVIVVIDPWSLRIPRYRQLMLDYDSRAFLNCGILVLWNAKDAETIESRAVLEQTMRATFSRQLLSNLPQFFRPNVQSAEEFKRELSQMLTALRLKILERASLLRPVEGEMVSKPTISRTRRRR
jgi:FxsC-like protein